MKILFHFYPLKLYQEQSLNLQVSKDREYFSSYAATTLEREGKRGNNLKYTVVIKISHYSDLFSSPVLKT